MKPSDRLRLRRERLASRTTCRRYDMHTWTYRLVHMPFDWTLAGDAISAAAVGRSSGTLALPGHGNLTENAFAGTR